MDMKVFVTEDILKLQNRFVCHDVGDLTKEIWKDRASLAQDKIFIHEENIMGKQVFIKLKNTGRFIAAGLRLSIDSHFG